MARITQRFLTVGERIYLYYGGVQGAHTGRKFKQVERRHQPMLGLATLRRDGFVSLDAGDETGYALTRPMRVVGDELHVNADATRGSLAVTLTDGEGNPLPGYASTPVAEDQTDTLVHFAQPLGVLVDRQVRLRLDLHRASLYSYWFASSAAD